MAETGLVEDGRSMAIKPGDHLCYGAFALGLIVSAELAAASGS